MILRYSTDPERIQQQCAKCKAVRSLHLATLQLGSVTPNGVKNPHVIVLPACSCGAVEALFRQFGSAPESARRSTSFRHRCVVNAIAQRLIALGKSHPACAADHASEESAPPDIIELGNGVRLA